MSINNVENCAVCNKIFYKTIRDICPECVRKEADVLLEVRDFLRRNKYATFVDCIENTRVTEKQLSKFIFDKRVIMSDNPNMGVKCSNCGRITQDPTGVCVTCKHKLKKELDKFNEETAEIKSRKLKTYYTD